MTVRRSTSQKGAVVQSGNGSQCAPNQFTKFPFEQQKNFCLYSRVDGSDEAYWATLQWHARVRLPYIKLAFGPLLFCRANS